MRTVNFRDGVLYPAARLLGIDTEADLNRNHAQALTDFANIRLQDGWVFWQWSELEITEERAFRTIWNAHRQFEIGDELFYVPTMSYFTTIATPPIGTLPSDTNYFAPLDVINRYIAYDQIGKRPIGQCLGVYPGNPFTTQGAGRGLPFTTSEFGIQLLNGYSGPTAWITYLIQESQVTSVAYDPAKIYSRGELVYWNGDGDCYEALVASFAGHAPPSSTFWRKVPIPAVLAPYLKFGIAADASDDLNTMQLLDAKATSAIQDAADVYQEQGQQAFYHRPRRCGYLSYAPLGAPPASSGTTLTDEDDPYAPEAVVMINDGLTQIGSGHSYVDVDLSATWTGGEAYSFDELVVKNFIDSPPLAIFPTVVVSQRADGFRVLVNSAPDNNHYFLKWRIAL